MIRSKNRPKITWSEGLEREKGVWKVKSFKLSREIEGVRSEITIALYIENS